MRLKNELFIQLAPSAASESELQMFLTCDLNRSVLCRTVMTNSVMTKDQTDSHSTDLQHHKKDSDASVRTLRRSLDLSLCCVSYF